MTFRKLKAVWLGSLELSSAMPLIVRVLARARIGIGGRSLEASVHFWVCTSNLRKDVRREAAALLAHGGLARLEHGVLRLAVGRGAWVTGQE